jgi:hypothetical protein
MGQREATHIGECRGARRIAVGEEVDRIAGCQDLIRSRDLEWAARRRQPPEPDNLAHKMRRESQLLRTNPQVTGGRNLFMELRPVSKLVTTIPVYS